MASSVKEELKKKASAKSDMSNSEFLSKLEFNKTWSDRLALFITDTFGSIKFLCLCLLLFSVWVLWNLNMLPVVKPFDPYPFPALEIIVALFAIILSVSVLISQNREGRMDKISRQVEFEVNVRAENEITKILVMLHDIQKKMGIDTSDTELENMKENIDLQQLHKQIDKAEPENTL